LDKEQPIQTNSNGGGTSVLVLLLPQQITLLAYSLKQLAHVLLPMLLMLVQLLFKLMIGASPRPLLEQLVNSISLVLLVLVMSLLSDLVE
jgi:hypothetical protein